MQRVSSRYLGQLPMIGYLAVMLFSTSCGPKARAVGEVRDGFGRPLGDVEVSIPGTVLKSTTRSNGQYSIPYVAGKFSINYAKNGYTGFSLSQDVAVETTVPLQPVVLYKRPSEQGLWVFGDNDYVPVKAGKLITGGGDRRAFAWLYKMTYQVAGEFTKVPRQKVHRFLDSYPAPLALLKVSEEGVLATRQEAFSGFGDTHAAVIKDESKRVAEGMVIREVSLEPGRYAYTGMSLDSGRVSGPVFPFEISAEAGTPEPRLTVGQAPARATDVVGEAGGTDLPGPGTEGSEERQKQKRTMSDMRSLATAVETYAVDNTVYPAATCASGLFTTLGSALSPMSFTRLTPTYIAQPPMTDGWAKPFYYNVSDRGDNYNIWSFGRDGRKDARLLCGTTTDFNEDIVYSNGTFVQWPEGKQR